MKKTLRGSKPSPSAAGADANGSSGGDSLRHCQNRLRELELENQSYKKEIEELKNKLGNVSTNLTDSAQKLKEDYLQKLTVLEDQVADLKNKLEAKSQFSVQRPKGDEATKQLQYEIQSLKTQKVQLQCKLKLESLQFRSCKASLEKEVLQIKRESRRNQYELCKLLDSNQRLKMVLQRKTLEASMITKRLKELLESRKALTRKKAGARNSNNLIIQGLEHELEVTKQLDEFCSHYEHQINVMAEESARLKEELEVLKEENLRYLSQEKDVHSLEEDPDIHELNSLREQVLSLGGLVRQLRLQKAELDHGNKSQDVSSHISVSDTKSDQSVKNINSFGSKHSKPSNVSRNKNASSVCCSCGKRSLCKTTKCQCRHMGGSCGASCGCAASKCTNRGASPIQFNDSPQSQISETKADSPTIVGSVKGATTSSSQGEMILKSALLEEPAEKIDNLGPNKKPLSDIGNIRLRATRKVA